MSTILTFPEAKAEVEALGDEAQYEGKRRQVNDEANAIINSFVTVYQRATLTLAFLDGFDLAAARQCIAADLGVPSEIRA